MSRRQSVPAKWRSHDLLLRHTVQIITDGAQDIVVSKEWSSRGQSWRYRAEPLAIVLFQIQMNRKQKASKPGAFA